MSREFPNLKIHGGEGDSSYVLIVFIVVNWFYSSLGKSSTTCYGSIHLTSLKWT